MKKFVLITLHVFAFSIAALAQPLSALKAKVEKAVHPRERAQAHIDLGSAYYYDGDFTKALSHYFKAIPMARKAKENKTLAVAYHGIGSVYMETEKYEAAIKYLQKAQHLFSELNEHKSLSRVLITLGNVYYMQMEDSLSEAYYLQALQTAQLVNDSASLMNGYQNLGALYFEMGNRSDTLKGAEFLKKSLTYIGATDTLNRFQSNLSLAELYTYHGNLSQAKPYLDFCAGLLPHIKALHIIDDYYYCLHHYYKEKGQPDQALSAYKQYKIYQDSILNTENTKQLEELNIKYETEQKEKQIELLNAKNNSQRLMLIVIILAVSIFIILAYVLFIRYKKQQKRKKEQELLKQKEAERIRIARDMHDEIGAGLTRIVMRSGQIKLNLEAGRELKNGIVETLGKMEDESRQLSQNIGEIIWALNPKNDALDALSAYIRNYAYDYLDEAGIACTFSFPDKIPDAPILPELRRNTFLIVKESLNNLVKYAHATEVRISMRISDNKFSITIEDNGQGVDSGKAALKGNGLENMRKRAEESGGKFTFKSEAGNGTCIAVENLSF